MFHSGKHSHRIKKSGPLESEYTYTYDIITYILLVSKSHRSGGCCLFPDNSGGFPIDVDPPWTVFQVKSFDGERFSIVFFCVGCHAKAPSAVKDELVELGCLGFSKIRLGNLVVCWC